MTTEQEAVNKRQLLGGKEYSKNKGQRDEA